jgi:hypothetical protein
MRSRHNNFVLLPSVHTHYASFLIIRQLLQPEKNRFLEVKPSTLILAIYKSLTYIQRPGSETGKLSVMGRDSLLRYRILYRSEFVLGVEQRPLGK